MAPYQEVYPFQCPYCAESISVVIDLTAGEEQDFTMDCEICCRPILIAVVVTEEGVSRFEAEREGS